MSTLWFQMNPAHGRIQGTPTNQISVGGNYIVRRKHRSTDTTRFVRTLRGKATAGGTINIIRRSNPNREFVRFTADPITGGSPRSELAPRRLAAFGQTVTTSIEFRARAPQLDQLTGYVLQFWQPVISPIAGVRLNRGRLEVVARTGGTAASKPLTRGWNELTITFRPGPDGVLRVKGDLSGRTAGRLDGGSKASRATDDAFRPKFGWYGPLSQDLTVDYRKFHLSVS